MSEDEMAGWHHQCNAHELGQTPGDDEGQGGLACYSPWGGKKSDLTEQLKNSNNGDTNIKCIFFKMLAAQKGLVPGIWAQWKAGVRANTGD